MMKLALLICIFVAPAFHAVAAPTDLPPDSRSKLEDVFARVADKLWLESDNAWHAGRLDVCIGICRFVVEIDPAFTEAYDVGGWLLSSNGRDAEAEALYQRDIAANPNLHKPFFDFGMFYYGKHDYANAETVFAQAVEKQPPAFVWKMLAHSREKLNKLPEALKTWEKVKELDPSDPAADTAIARIREELAASPAP